MNKPKKTSTRMGPAPIHGTTMTPVHLRLPPTLIAKIDSFAATRLDGPDRSTLIRQLIVDGLKANGFIVDGMKANSGKR